MPLLPYLHHVAESRNLSSDEAREAMQSILSGEATPAQIAGFLVALRMKGETVEELVGFARAMRQMAEPIDVGPGGGPLLDTCGTGGDGQSTFNISTLVAFVVAGAGVRVAKHGNRSISSQCGSADLLEALGVRMPMTPAEAARAIREIGIGFLFAPAIHTAARHAHPVRVDLKMRTAFNLLGPLTNPAGANAQLAGAPSAHFAELIAGALASLGLPRGFVVHGADGLDEITTTGPTLVFEIAAGRVERRTVTPDQFGVAPARPEDLKGGDRQRNCEIAHAVLGGARGPQRDIVLANASAALVAAGKAADFSEGVALAAAAIDSGAARGKLAALAVFV
ncbi:MAG TPA: anthranilate phosphoribosyltransferase [Bryobacteraceae bacterium]|nr:anthranilate phosphoribosyltransferase [Bryobacteraceae bacterium]